jgi:endonuclease III
MFDNLLNAEEQQRSTTIFQRLEKKANEENWERTAVQEAVDTGNSLRILISAMLSARTREEATRKATNNLFTLAQTAEGILQLSDEQIMQAIRMVTYPETKVPYVRGLCEKIVKEHDGIVPKTLEELSDLPGVGWKTGVLVLWLAFGIAEEICVDVHVARIGMRLGMVNPKTKQPEKVSKELMQRVPKELWGAWNPLMVRFGREICLYDRPRCPVCPLNDICPKVGVTLVRET